MLDNLPHDLIYSENQASPWMEVWVEKQHNRYTGTALMKFSLLENIPPNLILDLIDLWLGRG